MKLVVDNSADPSNADRQWADELCLIDVEPASGEDLASVRLIYQHPDFPPNVVFAALGDGTPEPAAPPGTPRATCLAERARRDAPPYALIGRFQRRVAKRVLADVLGMSTVAGDVG